MVTNTLMVMSRGIRHVWRSWAWVSAVYGGMQVRTSHLPRRGLQLPAFDWVLLQSSKLTTPSSTSLSHFCSVRLTIFVELWPSFKTTNSITLHRSYTISTWQSSDVGERRPTLREHPQFRRGFVFCRDCFVFRVCSGFRVCSEIRWGSSLFVSVLKTLGSWPFSSDFLELNRWYLKQNWWSLKTLKVISQTQTVISLNSTNDFSNSTDNLCDFSKLKQRFLKLNRRSLQLHPVISQNSASDFSNSTDSLSNSASDLSKLNQWFSNSRGDLSNSIGDLSKLNRFICNNSTSGLSNSTISSVITQPVLL